MPEIDLAPAAAPAGHTLEGGSAEWYNNALIASFTAQGTTLAIGRDSDKTPLNHNVLSHYDTSAIPLGSTVTKAKLTMKASQSESDDFLMTLATLAMNARLNNRQAQSHTGGRWIAGIYKTGFAAFSASNATSGENDEYQWRLANPSAAIYGQAYTTNSSGTFIGAFVRLERVGATSGSLYCKLYEAAGSAGAYTKGDLIATSAAVSLPSIPLTPSPTNVAFGSFSTEPGKSLSLSNATPYIIELIATGTFSSADKLYINFSRSLSGATDNMLVSAASGSSLQGFADRQAYLHGQEVQNATQIGTAPVPQPLQAFTSGTAYTFGDSAYAPDVTVSGLTALIQSTLDARSALTDWCGLVIDGGGVVDGRQRHVHSVRSATETLPGLKGIVLTIDYEPPVVNFTVKGRVGGIERVGARGAVADVVDARVSAGDVSDARVKVGG